MAVRAVSTMVVTNSPRFGTGSERMLVGDEKADDAVVRGLNSLEKLLVTLLSGDDRRFFFDRTWCFSFTNLRFRS